MKKIIISANVIWTITNFRKELIKYLSSNGYKVICVASKDELSINLEQVLRELEIEFYQVNIDRKGVNPINDIRYIINLYNLYKKIAPDVILHFTIKPNIYGSFVASLLKIPSINTINGLGSGIIKNNFLSKIIKKMYRFSLKNSAKVFFQNEDDLKFFIENNIVNKDKVGIVPGSGVDIDRFKNIKKKTNGKFTFLLIARLLKDKGIYEYIEAAKQIQRKYKNVDFLLAGQFDKGNPSAIAQEDIKKYIDKKIISYIGLTSNIEEFFELCDVIVLPSYREGLSRVLIEAASAYKPLIATDVPGCREIVQDNYNGLLCKPYNAECLFEALEKMIKTNKIDLDLMGRRSYQIAKEKFSKDIVNNIYMKAILKVI